MNSSKKLSVLKRDNSRKVLNSIRIIFLDFDGVLNATSYCELRHILGLATEDEFGTLFYPPAVRRLRRIIEKTDAKIVICSNWRLYRAEKMQRLWSVRNLPGEIIGITPYLLHESKYLQCQRGEEIRQWINSYEEPVESYVILDDRDAYYPGQQRHFIKTSYRWGCLPPICGRQFIF